MITESKVRLSQSSVDKKIPANHATGGYYP